MNATAVARHPPLSVARHSGLSVGHLLALALFWVMTATTVYPLIWLALNSLKTSNEMFERTWMPPEVFQWGNYAKAWNFGIAQYLMNSVIVTVVSVIAVVFLSALAAYTLTVMRFRGKGLIYVAILGGSILPPEVSLFPLFKILSGLGIYNTYLALILPYVAFGLPFTIFLIRAYMTTIPFELNEAARMDGAGPFRIFWSVYLPLSRPILASAALIQAMRIWNEFIFALTFVESESVKTITIGIMGFANALRSDWAVLMAGLVISVIPVLITFLVLQRQFIGGLTQGAVK
jgi:raffinose/stachyose/melibiose transport system permease protein